MVVVPVTDVAWTEVQVVVVVLMREVMVEVLVEVVWGVVVVRVPTCEGLLVGWEFRTPRVLRAYAGGRGDCFDHGSHGRHSRRRWGDREAAAC